jgi:hypothetical protein
MSRTIRTLIVFGAPVLVGVLNLFHPIYLKHTNIYDGLHAFTDRWITLHVLNLFGFALLGLAAYLLILERHGIAATVAKAALLLFVPFYAGFDSIIGIATGNLMRYASGLPLDQLPALKTAIDAFWNNSVATFLAIVGSVSWSLAMSASAISFARSRRAAAVALGLIAGAFTGWGYSANMFGTLPWWIGVAVIAAISLLVVRPALPFTLLILAGILFGTSHIPPFGPLGMAFFVAALAIIQTAPSRISARETSVPAGLKETQ